MEYPKRTEEHIKESDSWKVLEAKTPALWIIREVTERDYGIDAYIELVTLQGEVTGNLCSIQLKGTGEIEWTKEGPHINVSIPIATVNYWMGLPVPVFAILADLKTRRAFFAPVKSQVRSRYDEYRTQKTFALSFYPHAELGTDNGTRLFVLLELLEMCHAQFHRTLSEFLINWRNYHDFILNHSGWDEHLGVENDDELTFKHIYSSSIFLAGQLGIDWTLPSLVDVYAKEKDWTDEFYRLHQHTLNPVLTALEPIFLQIIDKCCTQVVEKQGEFWRRTDYVLFERCLNLNLKPEIEDCERRRKK